MKNLNSPIIFLLLILSFSSVFSQPANDNYASAIDVTALINGCSANAFYTTANATPDQAAGNCWNTTGGVPVRNVWFSFTAPASGQIKITIDVENTKGTQRRTQLALWQNDGTTQIYCNRYFNNTDDVVVGATGLTAGNTYYFSVDVQTAANAGTFTLCLANVVDYDFYEGATELPSINNWCSTDAAYTTNLATDDKNDGTCWGVNGINRWFKFVATTTEIKAELKTGASEGTLQYPYLALWEANGTTEIKCAVYTSQYDDIVINHVGLIPGNTYYLSVDNNTSQFAYRGTFTLCVTDAVDYDFYEGALDISSLMNSCSANTAYTTSKATNDKSPGNCWNTSGGSNRWFSFIATTNQAGIELKTGGSEGTLQYPYLALWDADGTTQIDCKTYTSQYSDLSINYVGLIPGNTYYISVDNNTNPAYRGTFTLCIRDAVDYDYYSRAWEITDLNNWCSSDAEFTTIGATNDQSPGSCWNTIGGANRWFKFQATSSHTTILITTGGSKGTLLYPYLALWESDGSTPVACSGYSSINFSGLTYNSLTPGNTYYISVDNHNGQPTYKGTFTLCINSTGTIFYSRANGSWNTPSTWSTVGYGGTDAKLYPNGGDIVNIQGNTVSATKNEDASELYLTVANANTGLTVSNGLLTINNIMAVTNPGNDFSGIIQLQSNGSLYVDGDLNFSRSGGNQALSMTINSGSSLVVNQDMNWSSSDGTTNNNILSANGTGTTTVNRDVNLTSTGGMPIHLQFSGTSVFTVGRNISYTANTGGLTGIILNNSAHLKIAGNFIRGLTPYGALICNNTSSVEYNGTANTQLLASDNGAGGDSFTYQNLIINNIHNTTPQLTAEGPVTVNRNLTLNTGIVATTETNILNLKNSSITGIGNTNSYIDGPMTYEVATNVANTIRNFPIGKNGDHRPVVLSVSHANFSPVIYTAEVSGSSAASLGYTLAPTTDRVSGLRYWRINRSGPANLSTAQATLYYGTNDEVTDYEYLTVVKNTSGNTTWSDIGGTATGNDTGSITSGAFNSFSDFTIANEHPGTNPLPVEFMDFKAIYVKGVVELLWNTASELNNSHFFVERSKEGSYWEHVQTVQGNGTSNQINNYTTSDDGPYKGTSYYRIKQIDHTKHYTYSQVISVYVDDTNINVYPNPVSNILTINYPLLSKDDLFIIDNVGKSITATFNSSHTHTTIDMSTMPKGVYFIKIRDGIYFKIFKVVKK